MQKEIDDLKSQYINLNSEMHSIHNTLSNLDSKLDRLVALVTPSSTDSSNSSNSTPSAPPSTQNSPFTPPTITTLRPLDKDLDFDGTIVTADLEALIDPKWSKHSLHGSLV